MLRQDAAFIARLAPSGGNRPFMVIDDGWQANHGGAKGEWDRGNAKFPDMAALAADLVRTGTRPGIWVRLLVAQPGQPQSWKLARDRAYLDPSVPEVRAYVTATARRLRGWGYELIKHDYSTFDLTGRWGFQMNDEMTADGWTFADRSRTTAEIVIDHYRSIRAGAGEAVLIGCNTIGHLSAGIFEVSRTGDDTSGMEWDRVRKMGVNTLAFRMPQHGASSPSMPTASARRRPTRFPGTRTASGSTSWLVAARRCSYPLSAARYRPKRSVLSKRLWPPPVNPCQAANRSTGSILGCPGVGDWLAARASSPGSIADYLFFHAGIGLPLALEESSE